MMNLIVEGLFNRTHWVVSTTVERFADRTNNPTDFIEEHWEGMIESPFVERVGEGRWTFALRFPDDGGDTGE